MSKKNTLTYPKRFLESARLLNFSTIERSPRALYGACPARIVILASAHPSPASPVRKGFGLALGLTNVFQYALVRLERAPTVMVDALVQHALISASTTARHRSVRDAQMVFVATSALVPLVVYPVQQAHATSLTRARDASLVKIRSSLALPFACQTTQIVHPISSATLARHVNAVPKRNGTTLKSDIASHAATMQKAVVESTRAAPSVQPAHSCRQKCHYCFS